jgi:hypothetical protein
VLDDSHAQRWVNREHLEGNLGVPFIAGLLDGDGFISAKVEYGRTIFGSLHSYWTFFQMSYPFLVDFIIRYTNHLVPGGAHFNRAKEGEVVKMSRQGRKALIANGIAIWSVKVSKWIGKVEELRRQISDLKAEFLSPAEVAVRLQQAVSRWTIREWCDRGYVRHIRIRATTSGSFRYLIPAVEAQTLDAKIRENRRYSEPMMSTGEFLSEKLAAHALGIKPDTVYHYCHRGYLKGIPLLTLGGRRTTLILHGEVEKWLKKIRQVRKTS